MAGLFFLLREGKGREFESSTAYQYYIFHLHLSCLLEKSKKRLGMTRIENLNKTFQLPFWFVPSLVPVYFRSYHDANFTSKNLYFSGIRTRIIGVEGKHGNHLTTITAYISIPENTHILCMGKYLCMVDHLLHWFGFDPTSKSVFYLT